ncbi:hypothetical protein AB8807_22295 (plasmid) [Xanthomonas campestris pv. olitorii]|uniref:Uncharacterized protein n=1 Tax=Burkholderia orbicola TaxID=2978683 RepID=A0ABT8P1F4_9BURK|nr:MULTISPECIES: hypothetical protein [Pseudomonadota]MCC8518287.1 hypothetical protein [Xanthomonas euvesicatoria pv. euvesicatoria]WVK06418.1 hypothetical protein KWH09_22535 [Xanthomonas campestris pv. olitorii]MCC8545944.1 hypothetical protein [Xanthomonas euvesicatoria pv. euvesicatoria]MCC8613242.1 hypothetical protein [Xanthomonas euvesicatoria pv. euvesicatoria]MDN7527670.1 hypothetical protein [Burkholderia orbicola]
MAININEALPVLETIYEQQRAISDRLRKLIETFKSEPEPVEPTLRLMLKPLNEGMDEMHQMLSPTSPDSLENPSES